MEPLEAAVRVLREQGKALHWTVIQDIALQRGYLSEAARREDGPVRKAGKGVYELRG
jgi:hypothetical protein